MGAFLKAHWKWIAGGIVAAYLIYLGYGVTRDLAFRAAMGKAKAEYQLELDRMQADKTKALKDKDALAEKAGRERCEILEQAEREKRKSDAVFQAMRSESAAALRKRDAKIAEVLAEKEKDEVVIAEAKETITAQAQLLICTLTAWRISETNLEDAHSRALAASEAQFSACQAWTARLEKKLAPKPLEKLLRGAVVLGAFAVGMAL